MREVISKVAGASSSRGRVDYFLLAERGRAGGASQSYQSVRDDCASITCFCSTFKNILAKGEVCYSFLIGYIFV